MRRSKTNVFDESLLDESLREFIVEIAKGLDIPPMMVVQNMLIRRLAEDDSYREVWDGVLPPLLEFSSREVDGQKTLITGTELYNMLFSMYLHEQECERVRGLLESEKYGIPLTTNEKALLIKHKQGNAWYESDEYRLEKEESERNEALREKWKDHFRVVTYWGEDDEEDDKE